MIKKFLQMIKKIFTNLDEKATFILKQGLKFCFVLCILSIVILIINKIIFTYPNLYNIGLLIFQASLIFATEFIICAIAIDKIKNQLG